MFEDAELCEVSERLEGVDRRELAMEAGEDGAGLIKLPVDKGTKPSCCGSGQAAAAFKSSTVIMVDVHRCPRSWVVWVVAHQMSDSVFCPERPSSTPDRALHQGCLDPLHTSLTAQDFETTGAPLPLRVERTA
jgi:hypothetical protein